MHTLGLIDLSSPVVKSTDLETHLEMIKKHGYAWELRISKPAQGPLSHLTDSSQMRLERLLSFWQLPEVQLINAVRGGYGASTLLPLLPWHQLATGDRKTFMGYSDLCALQSAVFNILGWPSIHGPMPATKAWREDDFLSAMSLLAGREQQLLLTDLTPARLPPATSGLLLFGGCFSVLTNLIGTPYLRPMRRDTILFLEDIDENPGRILRHVSQWQQSGLFERVAAIILGQFSFSTPGEEEKLTPLIQSIFTELYPGKIYSSDQFGHGEANRPLPVGGWARLEGNNLHFGVRTNESIA